MHRATWYAIPIVGLALLSSGLGVWSYHLNAQRQALVTQSDAQYSAAFHSLVSDMDQLTQRLSESEVSSGVSGFKTCASDIWRLSYAAQVEISKLPMELMPLHNTQAFLAGLGKQAGNWAQGDATTRSPKVLNQVDTYYKEATTLKSQLQSIQSKVLDGGLGWVAVNRAINQKNGYHTGDNQVVDGFRTIEKGLSTFAETASLGGQIEGSSQTSGTSKGGSIVSPTTAMEQVAQALGTSVAKDWKTTTSNLGGRETVYLISGSTSAGPLSAVVSRSGGHLLSMHVDRTVSTGTIDLAEAKSRAEQWLTKHGYGKVNEQIANEYDHVGYFVFVPSTPNGWAIQSPISINVAMDNGQVVALDSQAYFRNTIPSQVPKRKYSATQLRRQVNPNLQVEETHNVILRDQSGHAKSAVEFIGTHNRQTFAVILDATSGREIAVNQIS